MKSKNLLRKILSITVIFLTCLFFDLSSAKPITVEADGYYLAGNGLEENPNIARARARDDAKRAASEQAGVYILSATEADNAKLNRDEIKTLSASFMKIKSETFTLKKVTEMGVDFFQYHCHIQVVIDTLSNKDRDKATNRDDKRIEKEIPSLNRDEIKHDKPDNVEKKDIPEKLDTPPAPKRKSIEEEIITLTRDREHFNEVVRQMQDLEAESKRIDKEIKKLHEDYKSANEDEKQRIRSDVKRNEEKFTALQWNEEGLTHYTHKEYDKAIECYKKAIELDPRYGLPRNGLGWSYLGKNDFDNAIKAFEGVLALNEKYASPWNGLAYAANYQNDYDRAIENCQKAIALDPNYAAPQNNLGYAYNFKHEYDKAVECYKKAIALDPKDAAPWSNLGSLYDEQQNFDKAIECYEKALEVNSDYAKAWSNMGYSYSHKGDSDKALECFIKATQIDPLNAAAWNGLGYVHNQQQKFYKAAEYCRKAVNIDKNFANAWNNLGYAYAALGRLNDSLEAYKKAVSIAPMVEIYRKNLDKAKKRL